MVERSRDIPAIFVYPVDEIYDVIDEKLGVEEGKCIGVVLLGGYCYDCVEHVGGFVLALIVIYFVCEVTDILTDVGE